MRNFFGMLKQTFSEWSEDKAPTLAAALAFYTLFSLAPLLLLIVSILGLVFGQGAAQEQFVGQVRGLVGSSGADAVQTALENADQGSGGILGTIIGIVTLLFGATGIMVQLQNAMNTIWEVKPDPEQSGIMHLIKVRVLSLGMLLAIGFLLLVSLLVSTVLSGLGSYLASILPGAEILWHIVNFFISFTVITLLFALMFKYLPDVRIGWRDVWVGAIFTAFLFEIGKYALGLYLGNSAVASTYGAAGSLVVLLLWVFYSAQLFLFGAEFTQVYARQRGAQIEPAEHAVPADQPEDGRRAAK
jgi:membrane protein